MTGNRDVPKGPRGMLLVGSNCTSSPAKLLSILLLPLLSGGDGDNDDDDVNETIVLGKCSAEVALLSSAVFGC